MFVATENLYNSKEINVLVGQHVEIMCSVYYLGSTAPKIKWSMSDGIDPTLDVNITNFILGNSSLISTFRLYATRIINKAILQCITYFIQPISTENQTDVRKAMNAPTYEHHCTYQLNVLCKQQ